MKSKINLWIVIVFAYAVGLSACALNNEIQIESKNIFRPDFSINEFEFRFPSQSHIRLVPLYGSPWKMNGDLSDIIRDVMTEIGSFDFEGLANQSSSYMAIHDIEIVYQATMPSGADSILSVGLDLQFVGKYNGIYVDDCELGRIIPDRSAPLNHGLFATRDKMRVMIQPVYEDLIKEALTQALIVGLNCLSNKSESKLMN